MIYDWINSNIIVARVLDTYNVDYTGFISRVPHWINSAMKELGSYYANIDKEDIITITSYKGELPLNMADLRAVSYNGLRLNRLDVINYTDETDMSLLKHPSEGYEIVANNHIVTTFESGEVTVYYKSLPVELDSTTNLYFPLIPNNEILLLGLDSYVLKQILLRGHKVREFSLSTNNPYLNPALSWDSNKQKIRNSLASLNIDEREAISKMIRTFLVNFDTYNGVDFNPNADIYRPALTVTFTLPVDINSMSGTISVGSRVLTYYAKNTSGAPVDILLTLTVLNSLGQVVETGNTFTATIADEENLDVAHEITVLTKAFTNYTYSIVVTQVV